MRFLFFVFTLPGLHITFPICAQNIYEGFPESIQVWNMKKRHLLLDFFWTGFVYLRYICNFLDTVFFLTSPNVTTSA